MRQKLDASQKILEGLAREDFESIPNHRWLAPFRSK